MLYDPYNLLCFAFVDALCFIGLITRPGQSHWESAEDIFVCGEPDENSRKASLARLPKLTATMQPPSAEDAAIMHLEYCHRVLPQDNNTGGFFVAVLQLLEESAPTPSAYLKAAESSAPTDKASKKHKKAQEVSAEASMEIMRNLGYNPKHTTQNNKTQETKKLTKTPVVTAGGVVQETEEVDTAAPQDTVDVATVYDTLEVSEFENAVTSLGLDNSIVVHSTSPAGSSDANNKLFLLKSQAQPVVPKKDANADAGVKKEADKGKDKGTYNGIFGSRSAGWAKPSAADYAEQGKLCVVHLTT